MNDVQIAEENRLDEARAEKDRVEAEARDKLTKIIVGCVAAFIIITMIWYFGYLFGYRGLELTADIGAWGAFGDFVGGLFNPVMAGVGLVFFIMTLRQNEKALKMSAEELRLTRKELREAGAAQKELATIERENLENTKLMRNYESCQLAESLISKSLGKDANEEISIYWSSDISHEESIFSLNDLIHKHGSQITFYTDDRNRGLEALKAILERYISQLAIASDVLKEQKESAKKLNILFVSTLINDITKFNSRILNATLIVKGIHRGINTPAPEVLLIKHPYFSEMLTDYEEII